MSLEKRVREQWKRVLAIGTYPLTGNFPENIKDRLEYRFLGVYNKQTATIVSICTNPVLYTMIGGTFFGNVGAEVGLFTAVAEWFVRLPLVMSGCSPASLAGIVMTEEEGTTWKQRFKKCTKRFVSKWAVLGALGAALMIKFDYDSHEFEQKYKNELQHIQKQQISETSFTLLLNRKENISILAECIKKDKFVLAALPAEPEGKYKIDKDFLPYYTKEVKPELDLILQDHQPQPNVRFGYYEGIKEPLFIDMLGLLGLGGVIFGFGIQKRFRYSGISFYNLANSICDTVDHRRVGILPRLGGAMRTGYYGVTYLTHAILTEINMLGLIICAGTALHLVIGTSNSYNILSKQITITPSSSLNIGKTKEDLAIVLAHESTHAYQDRMNWPVSSTLTEGHARAIEILCAEEMAKKTGNKEWLRGPLSRELIEMKAMYYTLCANYSVAPDQAIIGEHDVDAVTKALYEHISSDGHAKGIALFRVAEYHYGQKVYSDVRAGRFTVLMPVMPIIEQK